MKKILITAISIVLVFASASIVYAVCYDCMSVSTNWTNRLGGADRIETAIKISQFLNFSGFGGADIDPNEETIIICRSDMFSDALAAAALAGVLDEDVENCAPILLNPGDELDERVKDEMKRLWGDDDDDENVVIVGGTGALSEDLEDEIEDMGANVERIGGDDRYETAVDLAERMEEIYGHVDDVLICTGENWPDALAASAYANAHSRWGSPCVIILVKKDSIPSASLDWLLANKNDLEEVYVIGGPGVVSNDVMQDLGYYLECNIERIAGDDRYETCVAVAEELFGVGADGERPGPGGFIFCTAANFPDALAAATFAHPILLTSSIDPAIEDYLNDFIDEYEEEHSMVIGGKGAISKETEDEIAELVSGGDFEPTTEEPEIKSFDVTIDDSGFGTDVPDVAQYDEDEMIFFDVTTDENIVNQDGSVTGNCDYTVWIEDVSELGPENTEYTEQLTYSDPFYLNLMDPPDDSGDNDFFGEIDVLKKSTSPEQRALTFTAVARNQAGTDSMDSDEVEVYN